MKTLQQPQRRVLAAYDASGVTVYQAFRTETVRAATEKGTFGAGFSLDRMTWIKPSFGWMLHRSGYASKPGQEAIARIQLSHEGFLAILAQAVPTLYAATLFSSSAAWNDALARSDVRCQWDPDRDLFDRKLEHRAIQLGIRGETVRRYVHDWILGIEEVTDLAHAVRDAAGRAEMALPVVPIEREYPVSAMLARTLGYDNYDEAPPGNGTV
ncbi:MAG: DUF4291 domain-containing protein [Cytophagales bacterium]|nr:DUF4291 domain-containing protein [Armatimonadota bacterium]